MRDVEKRAQRIRQRVNRGYTGVRQPHSGQITRKQHGFTRLKL